MSDTPPGWHPDPLQRHQYRFWDGTNWSDQVADSGQQSTDPFAPSPQAAPDSAGATPGATQDQATASPGALGTQAPGGPQPGPYVAPPPSKRSNLPLIVGIGVVVAIIVGVAVVLLIGGDKKSAGAGTFTIKLKGDKLASHEMNLKAGDGLYIKVDAPKSVNGAFTADTAVVNRLHDYNYLSDSYGGRAAKLTSDIFSDYSDYPLGSVNSDNPEFSADGFKGVFIRPITGQFYGPTTETLIPVKGRYNVVFISKKDATIKLTVKVGTNPKVKNDIKSDQLSDLDTNFYSDFYSGVTDESSIRRTCTAGSAAANRQSSPGCTRPTH